MVSMRGHLKSSRISNKKNTKTGMTSVVSSPSISSVTTKKETIPTGDAVTTITTTITTVRTGTSNAKSDTGLDTANPSGATGLTSSVTGKRPSNVSTTTITTTHNENGLSPVTTVTVDNGVNSTSLMTSKGDGLVGATTTRTDSERNGSGGSSTIVTNAGRISAVPSQETSSGATALASSSTASTSSSAKETNEERLADFTNTDSNTTNGQPSTRTTMVAESANSHDSWATTAPSSSTVNAAASIVSTNGSNGSVASTENAKTSSSAIESLNTSTAGASSNTGSATPSSNESVASSFTRSSSSLSSSNALKSWFTRKFRNNETQLVVGANSSATTTLDQVCNGLPALITRSNIEAPNGGCPDELTALNASCTCLTGYNATASSWTFHVTTKSQNSTMNATTRALTQSSSDKLAINTIRPIWVSPSLKTLQIEGTENFPEEIAFINENRETSSSSLPLAQSVSNSTQISTLSLTKLDLSTVAATKSDFVPVTVTNLTLRNCNISTLGSSFTRMWGRVQYLDLSSNNLNKEFVGGASLKELNLSYNALAVLPMGSLNSTNLEVLYIQGNDIKDFNVSQDQFSQIQALTAFNADKPPSSSTCQDGEWQSAHGATFCVLSASTAAADSSQSSGSTSDGDNNGLGLLSYWLIAGAIIVFFLLLLVIWQRRRHSREGDSSPILSPEVIEPTTPKCNANHAFGDALNHDNIASSVAAATGSASNIVHANAYPGYGRSHGNSIDSEDTTAMGLTLATNKALTSCRLDYDELILGRCVSRGGFGLVFVGSYRGRQVAVKKIQNEREIGREQVQQFVREISLISGLNHPRIVEFIGACWTIPTELSAVTEFMERGDLRDVTRRFKRRGYRLSWESHKANIALHIAEALTYLHGLTPTVIHRDLKAKNVVLNADMEAKLSDFGIARERSSYDGSEHMTVGIGTSFWIAPEVLLGHDYNERADIYSYGVVLSEIDTDDYPYWNTQHQAEGKAQENEILRLVARGSKRPAFSDDCPPAILELATRCLRADPEERPSAFEIVLYLQQLVRDRNSSASFPSIAQADTAFDDSRSNSPANTVPANAIVNVRPTGEDTQQNQEMVFPPAAVANAPGRRLKTTMTTATMKTDSLSVATISRPAVAQVMIASSRQVPYPIGRSKLPPIGKTTRRDGQGNASSIFDHTTLSIAGGIENVGSSDIYACARPTSPSSIQARHLAEQEISRQQQLSSSSGKEATAVERRRKRLSLYEDGKETK